MHSSKGSTAYRSGEQNGGVLNNVNQIATKVSSSNITNMAPKSSFSCELSDNPYFRDNMVTSEGEEEEDVGSVHPLVFMDQQTMFFRQKRRLESDSDYSDVNNKKQKCKVKSWHKTPQNDVFCGDNGREESEEDNGEVVESDEEG